MIRYIITGAAGHLGSTIVRSLLHDQLPVRGLLLPADQPAVSGPEYVIGDVLEPRSLGPMFQRENDDELVVIHTAGIVDATGGMDSRLYEVNVTGTENILRCCAEYKVNKLVYVSSVHAIPENSSSERQTEILDFSPELVAGGYAKTKAQATKCVLDAAATGLPAVVVQPTGIIGPYDNGRNHLVQLVLGNLPGRRPMR